MAAKRNAGRDDSSNLRQNVPPTFCFHSFSASGHELGRFGQQLTGTDNSAVPFDTPSGLAYLGSDLIVVVYNDGSYGAEHIQFHMKGMDPGLSLHHWPDLAPVAMIRVAAILLLSSPSASRAELTPGTPAPDFLGNHVWINSRPLSLKRELKGKIVLVDFWEYTCINWIRTLPYIKAWNRDYASLGLVVVGVHAPEFEFGKRAENIDRGVRDHGLTYPIAIDNDFTTWIVYRNRAWPAKYLFDKDGKVLFFRDDELGGERADMEVRPKEAIRGVRKIRFTSLKDQGDKNPYRDIAIGEILVE